MVFRLGWPRATGMGKANARAMTLVGVAAAAAIGCGDASEGVADASDGVTDARDSVETTQGGDVVQGVPPLAYAPCDAATRVGLFTIARYAAYTAVEGRVASGVVPANVRVETDREGECRLVEGRVLVCDPACVAGETCGDDGVCIDYPVAQSVGEVVVEGLTVALAMTPTSLGAYGNGATSIPHPGFAEGDALTLFAPGAALPGFTLEGRGVAPLVVAESEAALVRDADLIVTWTPGEDPSARMRFVLDLAHHGGIAASLECDGLADDGAFALPARLVSALLDIGVAGFPTLTVSRRSADSAAIAPGCVELDVVSEVVLPVTVDGVVSCASDEDCAAGTTCQLDLTCR